MSQFRFQLFAIYILYVHMYVQYINMPYLFSILTIYYENSIKLTILFSLI